MSSESAAFAAAAQAQARLLHAWLLGLMLRVTVRHGAQVMGDWMFALFRRQHHEKFLSSFAKLGLEGLPHAVACARYHVLSNGIGGVAVEYHEEGPRKAWVRFRTPRWMYDGAVLCAMPVEVSRGFLRGWYAHNGVSLGNPRLGFVCVSEDMTGEWGLCGYFREFDHDLAPEERLQFARDEVPPRFDPTLQPQAPAAVWDEARLQRAARNYAMEYLRNGLTTLAAVVGEEAARGLARESARLIGLQFWRETAAAVGAGDGDARAAADYLCRMARGMEDRIVLEGEATPDRARLRVEGLRIVRGLADDDRDRLLEGWQELWVGAVRAHRHWLDLHLSPSQSGALHWEIRARGNMTAPSP